VPVQVLRQVAAVVEGLRGTRTWVAVAVDGPDAAGKTTFADALAVALTPPARRVRGDDFQNPVEVRHRGGDRSPEGYYRDTVDVARLDAELRRSVAPGAVLVVDGVFLLQPALASHWTLSVYLHVPPEVTLARAAVRDRSRFGDELERRYGERYLPGQAMYRAEVDPLAVADIVIDNSDCAAPVIVRWPR
jgi:uridine kinase